jgi:hypothetical protein
MFEPMLVGAMVGGTASALSLVHHYRQQLGPMTLREARLLAKMPVTPIGDAGKGLVKVVGVVHASLTALSYYDRVACPVLELRHYERTDGVGGTRRLLVRTERTAYPFWIEDESGRVAIDPERARLDLQIEGADLDSTIEERRIRLGERVAVLGYVRRATPTMNVPMRDASAVVEQGFEFAAPPLVTWRSEPEVYPRLLPPTGSLALSAGSIGMAVLGSLLRL